MKIVYKKKIYNGSVEFTDYEIKKLSLARKPIKIIIDREYMVLSYKQLMNDGTVVSIQQSKFNRCQTYKLIGFKWRGKPMGEQISINYDVRLRLAEEFKKKYGEGR